MRRGRRAWVWRWAIPAGIAGAFGYLSMIQFNPIPSVYAADGFRLAWEIHAEPGELTVHTSTDTKGHAFFRTCVERMSFAMPADRVEWIFSPSTALKLPDLDLSFDDVILAIPYWAMGGILAGAMYFVNRHCVARPSSHTGRDNPDL